MVGYEVADAHIRPLGMVRREKSYIELALIEVAIEGSVDYTKEGNIRIELDACARARDGREVSVRISADAREGTAPDDHNERVATIVCPCRVCGHMSCGTVPRADNSPDGMWWIRKNGRLIPVERRAEDAPRGVCVKIGGNSTRHLIVRPEGFNALKILIDVARDRQCLSDLHKEHGNASKQDRWDDDRDDDFDESECSGGEECRHRRKKKDTY